VIDRSQVHPAYILHRRPFSNTSLLIECFSLSHGRFPAVAKGVNRRNSSATGLLQPFQPLLIRWSGRGEVKTLNFFEAAAPSLMLQGQILYCGFYLNELIFRLLERDDPYEALFGIYGSTLSKLSQGDSVEPVLRRFEIELLEQLGFGLVLDRNVQDGSALIPEQRYHYEMERGPVPCSHVDPSGISGATLIGLHSGCQLDEALLFEARKLTRVALRYYLGDRPLKSRELFRTSGEK
jgi:DNA repair protein RecO (recombination protein O)